LSEAIPFILEKRCFTLQAFNLIDTVAQLAALQTSEAHKFAIVRVGSLGAFIDAALTKKELEFTRAIARSARRSGISACCTLRITLLTSLRPHWITAWRAAFNALKVIKVPVLRALNATTGAV
jgi:hypothetical protein